MPRLRNTKAPRSIIYKGATYMKKVEHFASRKLLLSDTKFWAYLEKIKGNETRITKVVPEQEYEAFATKFFAFAKKLTELVKGTFRDSHDYGAWAYVGAGRAAYQDILQRLQSPLKRVRMEAEDMLAADPDEDFGSAVSELTEDN